MKCNFKTDKFLTAVKETDHTVTTSEGRIIHKKLAFKPLIFQTSKRTDEQQRRVINRCCKCGTFSSGEFCGTHQQPETEHYDQNNNTAEDETTTSQTLPTMPSKKKRNYNRVVVYDSSSRDSNSIDTSAEKDSTDTEDDTEGADLRADIGREIERLRAQTPLPTSPIGCSTEGPGNTAQPDHSGTPIHGQETITTAIAEEEPRSKQKTKIEKSLTKNELEPRRSERIKTAQRVVKLGGVEYFWNAVRLGNSFTFTIPKKYPSTLFPRIKKNNTAQDWFPWNPTEGEMWHERISSWPNEENIQSTC